MASILGREAADVFFDSNHILFCGNQCIIELHMMARGGNRTHPSLEIQFLFSTLVTYCGRNNTEQ